MSRSSQTAGRIASYLLAAAALPLVACMDLQDPDPKNDPSGAPSDITAAHPVGEHTEPPRQIPNDPPDTIAAPTTGTLIVAAEVTCNGNGSGASIEIQLAAPADEVEVRMQAHGKVTEYGRFYLERESFPVPMMHKVPSSPTYPYFARIGLEGSSCADFKAQLDQVRVISDHTIETFDLSAAPN